MKHRAYDYTCTVEMVYEASIQITYQCGDYPNFGVLINIDEDTDLTKEYLKKIMKAHANSAFAFWDDIYRVEKVTEKDEDDTCKAEKEFEKIKDVKVTGTREEMLEMEEDTIITIDQ